MSDRAQTEFQKLTKFERVDLVTAFLYAEMLKADDEDHAVGQGGFQMTRRFMGKRFKISVRVEENND